MMMVPAGVTGMLIGMVVPVVERDIAEQDMLMIAGNTLHVLDVRDHACGPGPSEDKHQCDAKKRAELSHG